jgi:signal transduction histidine kinase
MSRMVEHTHPGWMQQPPAPHAGEGTRQVDGAWRVWEKLRAWDQRFAIAVDATLAVGLFVITSGWLEALAKVTHPDLFFVAGLTLPLVLRRRAPVGVFLLIAVVAVVQWALTGPLLADTALLAALYTVTAESEWIAVIICALILEIGVILATARWTPVGNYFKSLIFLTGMASVSLLAGIVVRALRSRIDWLAERAHRLEVERDQQTFLAAAAERARIAREMHDVVSHNIQVMVTLADAAAVAQRVDPQRSSEAMMEVSGTGRQALSDMRRLLGLLRDDSGPSATGTGRLTAPAALDLAPQPGLSELDALAERVRSTGLAVNLQSSGEAFDLSDAAGLTVYRIVQEALTNALKHALSATSVRVSLSFNDPEVMLTVVDDGHTPPPIPSSRSGVGDGDQGGGPVVSGMGAGAGHGLVGMTERAAAFGGTLVAGPDDEGGWRVTTTLRGCKVPVHS